MLVIKQMIRLRVSQSVCSQGRLWKPEELNGWLSFLCFIRPALCHWGYKQITNLERKTVISVQLNKAHWLMQMMGSLRETSSKKEKYYTEASTFESSHLMRLCFPVCFKQNQLNNLYHLNWPCSDASVKSQSLWTVSLAEKYILLSLPVKQSYVIYSQTHTSSSPCCILVWTYD